MSDMPKPVLEIDNLITMLDSWRDDLQGDFNNWDDQDEDERDEEEGEILQNQLDELTSVIDALKSL
jgi:hypothetical protein